jgi:hypothetical protein
LIGKPNTLGRKWTQMMNLLATTQVHLLRVLKSQIIMTTTRQLLTSTLK